MRILLLILLLSSVLGDPALAQYPPTTVRIENGSVFLDNRKLSEAEYPASLRTAGQHAQFRFIGETRFYIDGRPYTVRQNQIVEVEPEAESSIVVMLRSEDLQNPAEGAPTIATFQVRGAPSQTIGSFAKVLDARAARMERLGDELAMRGDDDGRTITVGRMHQEAEEAALMMRAFPRIEMKSYLDGLLLSNSALHGRLIRELEMENESGFLAARILAENDSQRRTDLESNLRARLDEVFELKQQNRRDEIVQLERQLAELRTQLQSREANRRAIIDRRLDELLAPIRR